MLRLHQTIKLSKRDKRYVRELFGLYGLCTDLWYNQRKRTMDLKRSISFQLHVNQRFRCVYCETTLINRDKEIDHIAPQSLHPKFTYERYNLVYACGTCNSIRKKGDEETINVLNDYYAHCTFHIVHPYKDNPDVEILYQDADRIYLDVANSTNKGKWTIGLFGFDTYEMTEFRAKELKLQRDNPINDGALQKLVKEAVSFKRKP